MQMVKEESIEAALFEPISMPLISNSVNQLSMLPGQESHSRHNEALRINSSIT